MVKVIGRMVIAPLVMAALLCSGMAAASLAPDQAVAATADQLTASAVDKTLDTQALKAAKSKKAAKAKKAKKAFTGKYELVKMMQDGKVTGAEDLKLLRASGLEVTLNLKKNGKAVLDLFNEKMQGTWKASTAKRGTIKMSGQAITMKKNGKKVTLTQKGASLVFKKK